MRRLRVFRSRSIKDRICSSCGKTIEEGKYHLRVYWEEKNKYGLMENMKGSYHLFESCVPVKLRPTIEKNKIKLRKDLRGRRSMVSIVDSIYDELNKSETGALSVGAIGNVLKSTSANIKSICNAVEYIQSLPLLEVIPVDHNITIIRLNKSRK